MSENEQKPNPYAKGIEAGFKPPTPTLDRMKSAWMSIKTDLGFGEKKNKNDFTPEEIAEARKQNQR